MNSTSNNINQEELKRLAAREGLTFFGLTLPYLIMVIALIAIPVGWLFYLSFVGRDGTLSLENYERMWKSKAYIKIFITTFKISILTTIICACDWVSTFLLYVPAFQKMGKHLYDCRLDTLLDELVSSDLRVVSSFTKKRADK
jgi:ABC-type spermidine/putrescine transport system permease subunit I